MLMRRAAPGRLLRAIRNGIPLLALLGPALAPAPSDGLPLFSRQLQTPCASCHSAVPRLDPAGVRFLQNGYRPQGAAVSERALRPTGLPVSVLGGLGLGWSISDERAAAAGSPARVDSRPAHPRRLELESAGALSQRLSYDYASALDADAGKIETAAAFVQLNDLVRAGGLNVKLGRFDEGPAYLSSRRRATLRDYLSPIALAAHGLELNGTRAGWTYGAGLFESQRPLPPAPAVTSTLQRLEDTDLWLTDELHGQLVGARMLFDRQESNLRTLTWLQHLQAQGSALLNVGRVQLLPAYTFDRFDDRPSAGIHDRHQYGLLEALEQLGSERRWALTERVEHEYKTRTVLTREEDHDLEALSLGYEFGPNRRATLECAQSGDNIGDRRTTTLDAFLQLAY
jgi:hypothetical protein